MHRLDCSIHETFQALSDPYRVRLVALLLRAKTEMCLCELTDSLDEPEYKLSRHLKVLKSSGVVTANRDGKWIYHSLVSNNSLTAIYQAIEIHSNVAKQCEKDFLRFKQRVLLREGGRCRQSSRSTKLTISQ